MKLTDAFVRALAFEAGQRDYPDDGVRGLSVRVGIRTKTFMLLLRTPSSRTRVKLGTYPDLSLSRAREQARDLLAEHRLKKDEPLRTVFAEAFEVYKATHLARIREGTRDEQIRLMRRHFIARLGKHNLADLSSHDIAPLIDVISRPVEQRNAFIAISIFLNWCAKRSYIDNSPIARLEAPKKPEPRSRVLTPAELVAVWNACPENDYGHIVKLLILTAQRAGQWAAVKAEYIAPDHITWPAAAMKAGKAHTLPLTDQARALIPKRVGLLFPSTTGTPFIDWHRCKQQLDRDSGVTAYVHHDLRRTWATIAAEELDVQPHIIESVLAHSTGTQVARIYNRAKYQQPMRTALLAFEEWLHLQVSKPEDIHERRQLL